MQANYTKTIYYLDDKIQNEYTDKFYTPLNKKYEIINDRPCSSEHIFTVLEDILSDSDRYNQMKLMRDIEKSLRNMVAHEIVSIDENMIKNKMGKDISSSKIIECIKQIAEKMDIVTKKEMWKSCDKLNEEIIKYI